MALEIRKVISDVHEQAVLCVAYNPLQRQIFTGSQDSTIRCWQSENCELVRTLKEHAGWVTGLEFAADIRVLFSCSIDGFVVVWSTKGEVLDRERAGGKEAGNGVEMGRKQSGPLYCLCWDPRRQQLVVGANGHIWVFSVHTGENVDLCRDKILQLVGTLKDDKGRPPHALSGSEDPVRGIINTDIGKIFSAGYDRTLRVWDTTRVDASLPALAHGDHKRKPSRAMHSTDSLMKNTHTTINSHDGAISAVTFDPDNNLLITGGFDRSVRIWACDGKRVSKIDGFSDTLTGLAYAPATKTLWMSANSAQPVVYDPRTLTDISKYLQTRPVQHDKDRADQRIQRLFTIKETGEVLAATSGRQLVIWRYNKHGAAAILRAHTDGVEALTHFYRPGQQSNSGTSEVGEDALVLLSAGSDATVRRWQPVSRMNPALYENTASRTGHEGAVLCALYCAEMACFITSGDDGTIRLWPEGEELQVVHGVDSVREAVVLDEHTDHVTGLVAIGKTLVSVSWDLTLRIWDLTFAFEDRGVGPRCESTHVIQNAHDDYMLSVAYSPELRQIASASADQGVKMWDLDCDTEESAQEKAGTEAMFVPESKRGKRCCGVLLGHTADVTSVLWNAHHSMWVTASEDRTARLWNADGVQLGELIPPGGSITALAIDLSYGHVLIATMDKSLRTYVVALDSSTESQWPWQFTQVQQNVGHSDAVRCILHIPERRQYITASWDRTLRVWAAYSKRDGDAAAVREPGSQSGAQFGGHRLEGPTKTYAELHPLIEPKWLTERAVGPDGHDRVLRKEDAPRRRKKLVDEDAGRGSGLGQKLHELESRLKAAFDDGAGKGHAKEHDHRRLNRMQTGGSNQSMRAVRRQGSRM